MSNTILVYFLKMYGNKKGMGVSTFAHPCSQAFALPQLKDKQRSQPTPSRIIYDKWLYIIIYSNYWDIIHPNAGAYRCDYLL